MENKDIKAAETKDAKAPEAKDNKTVYTHKLDKPFKYQEREYHEIKFDFGALSGNDALAVEEELEAINKYILAPETSKAYQSRMAAKAAGVSNDLLEALPLQDFNRITNAARNFLVGQAL